MTEIQYGADTGFVLILGDHRRLISQDRPMAYSSAAASRFVIRSILSSSQSNNIGSSSSTVTGTAATPFHLSFTNPADGFSSTDNAQVSTAALTYFAPGQSLQTPKSTNQAYLVLGLQSSYPDIPYGQPNSGHFFSSFNPMAGSELTFTPIGASRG